jgi:hypothetical protein
MMLRMRERETEVPGKRNSVQHMKMKAVVYYYLVTKEPMESHIFDRHVANVP